MNFNSIKVRLEPFCHNQQYLLLQDFNSIKVRLEHLSLILIPMSSVLFQFHKGAIRTSGNATISNSTTAFQFHKGAIRTGRSVLVLQLSRNFNSIKVRLERKDGQSITPFAEFQFHKGAIRTCSFSLLFW